MDYQTLIRKENRRGFRTILTFGRLPGWSRRYGVLSIGRVHGLAAIASGRPLQRVIGTIDDQDLRIGLGFAAIVCARSKRRHASGNADAVPEEHGQPDAFPASNTVFTAMRASRRRRGDAIRDAHHAVHWLR